MENIGGRLGEFAQKSFLSPRRVQSFRSIREEEVSDLVGYVHSKTGVPFNLSEKIFSLTYSITARAVFGKKCKEQEAFISAVEEGLKIAAGFSITEAFPSQTGLHWFSRMGPKLEKKVETIDIALENILNEHKADRSAKADTRKEKCILDVLLDLLGNSDLAFPLETT
ncbi:Cytochrome P, partial [Parasponia andersonii]